MKYYHKEINMNDNIIIIKTRLARPVPHNLLKLKFLISEHVSAKKVQVTHIYKFKQEYKHD